MWGFNMSDYQCGTAYSFYYANDFFIGFYNGDIESFEVSSELYKANSCTGVTKYVAVEDGPEPKKAYTAAMCDSGTLPLVGMECLIYSYDSPAMLDKKSWHKTRVLSIDSDLHSSVVVTYTCKWNADFYVDCHPVESLQFKPLTPPIELVDGKAYQFDTDDGITWVGFYGDHNDCFYDTKCFNETISESKNCTNIQLLEVKS